MVFGNSSWRTRWFAGSFALLALPGCDAPEATESVEATEDGEEFRHWFEWEQESHEFTCGYEVKTVTLQLGSKKFGGWIRLTNKSGDKGKAFELALDTGGHEIQQMDGAELAPSGNGYVLTAPKSLKKNPILRYQSHFITFKGKGNPADLETIIRSINGQTCDPTPPEVTLAANEDFFTAPGTLVLTADAADGAGIRNVVFARDGEVIGQATEAPYTLEVAVDAQLNGRHHFTATAMDQAGNTTTSSAARVLVAIGNRFLGTAPSSAADFASMGDDFNQLTPEDAGKWGVVEAARDQMNWAPLDTAYAHARDRGMVFKLHTLIWGQQQPAWLASLSAEEQLAEIEEWYAALAARYPDAQLIDVVNEPLHAPPSYAAALGGAGATGWDWVITSFEMARRHFPRAELILNDYQILSLAQFTNDYLEIIELLQERGLIDGIGLQAHFYERAEISVVEQNLATLAATGLPIYISEFDVNFADDARHANVLRDLASVFFANPSVVGLTHWGHLQGDVWQTNAYLIRSDGSQRPGMDWLLCAHAGGTNCTVPEYIPSGWQGTEAGLVLQAEDFDEGHGVLTGGGSVSYTDQGDWIAFSSVTFDDAWDMFEVTYAKGGGETGSISLHLGSPDAAPLMEVDLPPTAGWGTNETIEVPWVPMAGTHDLYVRFNHVYGVGNVDSIGFTAPAVEPTEINLVQNGHFEVNTAGWTPWYLNPTLSVTNTMAHSGSQSLRVSNRTSGGGDNARYLLTNVVAPGTTYNVSAWVAVGGTAVNTARLSAVVQCSNPPAGHNTYPWIHNNSNVTPGQWVELSGSLTIPNCNLTEVSIYIEGTTAGTDVYIDDVSVRPPSSNLIQNSGFESGTSGWDPWYLSPTLTTSTDVVYAGSQSLRVTNRTSGSGDNARYNLTNLVTPGTTYAASAWATIGGTQTGTVRLSGVVQCSDPPAGHNAYPWIQNNSSVVPGTWVNLAGTLTIPNCNVTEASIYIEGTAAGTDMFVDEVSLVPM